MTVTDMVARRWRTQLGIAIDGASLLSTPLVQVSPVIFQHEVVVALNYYVLRTRDDVPLRYSIPIDCGNSTKLFAVGCVAVTIAC